jgi:hypothetical protein
MEHIKNKNTKYMILLFRPVVSSHIIFVAALTYMKEKKVAFVNEIHISTTVCHHIKISCCHMWRMATGLNTLLWTSASQYFVYATSFLG